MWRKLGLIAATLWGRPLQDESVAGNFDFSPNLLQVFTESFAELESMQPSPQKVVLIKQHMNITLGGTTNQI